eukprot:s4835_g1.t1
MLAEAVYEFYQRHLDNLIRSNTKLRGDFCEPKKNHRDEIEYDAEGHIKGLRLYPPAGWKPGEEIPMNEKTINPQPEHHFSFNTKMTVLAIQLYRENVEHTFHPFTQHAYEKLVAYVESKKTMTQESYRHFVEHAYNQFFVHQAFHESSRSRTRAKDIGATEPLGTSTKLDAFIWIQDEAGTKRIPKTRVDEDEPMPAEPTQGQEVPTVEQFPDELMPDYDDDRPPLSPEHEMEDVPVDEEEDFEVEEEEQHQEMAEEGEEEVEEEVPYVPTDFRSQAQGTRYKLSSRRGSI